MALPVVQGSGVTTIVAALQKAIENGVYADGQRLPAERDLAGHFGSSRTTIREALRQLEEKGLITRRIGSGTFVHKPTLLVTENIAEITSPLELMEVREAIEPRIASMAVMHATAKDLERLQRALEMLDSCGNNKSRFSSADEVFHLALAEATGNPLMAWIYRQINDIRSHDQWNAMKHQILNDDVIASYNREHQAIVTAIQQRDAKRAADAVIDHLDQARRHLVGAGQAKAR